MTKLYLEAGETLVISKLIDDNIFNTRDKELLNIVFTNGDIAETIGNELKFHLHELSQPLISQLAKDINQLDHKEIKLSLKQNSGRNLIKHEGNNFIYTGGVNTNNTATLGFLLNK